TPRRGDTHKSRDEIPSFPVHRLVDRLIGNQPSHAVSHHVALLESVAFLQDPKTTREPAGDAVQSHTARIMAEPELVTLPIEMLDEIPPILRGTSDAIDQHHRDARGVVGLREVNTHRVATQEIEGPPHSPAAHVPGEPRLIER